MSRIYPLKAPQAAGDVFTAREFNAEARQFHGEFNGRLDRENIGGSILTAPRLAVDAISERVYQEGTTGRTVEDVETWPERIGAVDVARVNAAARAVIENSRSVTPLLLPEKD